MRERLGRWLHARMLEDKERKVHVPWLGETPWEELPPDTKEKWCGLADKVFSEVMKFEDTVMSGEQVVVRSSKESLGYILFIVGGGCLGLAAVFFLGPGPYYWGVLCGIGAVLCYYGAYRCLRRK